MTRRTAWWLIGAVAVGMLVFSVPLFVCSPPFIDADFYAIPARIVLRGEAPESRLRFFAPPGMVLLRTITEGPLGGRSETTKAVDLLVVAVSIALLLRWLRDDMSGIWLALTALVLGGFYLSTVDNCHIQPDVWMLPFTLAAVLIRRRQLRAILSDEGGTIGVLGRAVAEGACWGLGCLIKPHVMVPGVLAWLAATVVALRRSKRRRLVLLDAAGMVVGGLLAGGLWVIYFAVLGGWADFRRNMDVWGSGFTASEVPRALRTLALFAMFAPWSLLHLWTIPVGVRDLWRGVRTRESTADGEAAVFAAFYLGWAAQSVWMQSAFHYHLVSPMLLGLALFMREVSRRSPRTQRTWLTATAVGMILVNPYLVTGKGRLWLRCLREGSSPAVRDELSAIPYYPAHVVEWADPEALVERFGLQKQFHSAPPRMHIPEWQDLARVADFLRAQNVQDGEVTCYHTTTCSLYLSLGLTPSTPSISPDADVVFFPGRSDLIRTNLAQSRQRFIVSDLQRATVRRPHPPEPGRPFDLPANFPDAWRGRYPWSEPIVFRAGRYAVHRVVGPVTPLTGLVVE